MGKALDNHLSKSLHTITVYTRLAQHLIDTGAAKSAESAINQARSILGHNEKHDIYGLTNISEAQLTVKG